jgi:hypothetical protein
MRMIFKLDSCEDETHKLSESEKCQIQTCYNVILLYTSIFWLISVIKYGPIIQSHNSVVGEHEIMDYVQVTIHIQSVTSENRQLTYFKQ